MKQEKSFLTINALAPIVPIFNEIKHEFKNSNDLRTASELLWEAAYKIADYQHYFMCSAVEQATKTILKRRNYEDSAKIERISIDLRGAISRGLNEGRSIIDNGEWNFSLDTYYMRTHNFSVSGQNLRDVRVNILSDLSESCMELANELDIESAYQAESNKIKGFFSRFLKKISEKYF